MSREGILIGEGSKASLGGFDKADFANLIDKRDGMIADYFGGEKFYDNSLVRAEPEHREWYEENILPYDIEICALGNRILEEVYGRKEQYAYLGDIYLDEDLDDWYNKCVNGEVERTIEL